MALGPVGATSYNNSQVIRFQPDPGEPAVRLAAPANQSALLVTSQEQRNETRLRSQAVISGDQILFSNRTFTPSVVGGDQAITAGLTTIVTREGANQPNPEAAMAAQNDRSLTDRARDVLEGNSEEEDQRTPAQDALVKTADANQQNAIDRDADEVDRELDQVESDREEAESKESEAAAYGSPLEVQQSRAEQARLELEESQLEREKRQLDLERFGQRVQEANEDFASVLEGSLAAATGPLAALFGASDPGQQATRGQRLDLVA